MREKRSFLKRMRGVGAMKNGPNLLPFSAIYSAFTAMKQNQNGPTLGRGDGALCVGECVHARVCWSTVCVGVFIQLAVEW